MSTFQKYVGRIGGVVAASVGLISAGISGTRYHNNINISEAALTGIVFNFVCSIVLFYVSICHNSLQLTFPRTWRPNLRLIQGLTLIQIISQILVLGSSPRWETEQQRNNFEEAKTNLNKAKNAYAKALTAWKNGKTDELQTKADQAKQKLIEMQNAYDAVAPVVPYNDGMLYVSLVINIIVFCAIVYSFSHDSISSIKSVAAMEKQM